MTIVTVQNPKAFGPASKFIIINDSVSILRENYADSIIEYEKDSFSAV